jgi:hypothetical protein
MTALPLLWKNEAVVTIDAIAQTPRFDVDQVPQMVEKSFQRATNKNVL